MSLYQGVGGVLTGLVAAAVVKGSSLGRRKVALAQAPASQLSMCKTPPETFEALVAKGEGNTKMSTLKTFYASFMGGCYVGMAGLLSLAISGNLGVDAAMGVQKMVFAALFPVNLLLVLQSGGQLFTGNTATMSAAYCEGKATFKQLAKNWVVSWIGNVLGGCTLALVAWYTGLLTGGTASMTAAYALKKCHQTFGQAVIKAIMCNWLVCMAVYLSLQANDLTGKMVGIWFPISTFVAIGFEHSVANMFILPAALLSHAPLTIVEVLTKNLIPVTIGNAIAGAVIIGAGFSFAHGSLGKGK